MRKNIVPVLCLLYCLAGYSQPQKINPLKVGDVLPVAYRNKLPFKKNTRLIILDFWYTTCGNCLANFPRMQKLQQQFGDKLQIVMVNWAETNVEVKSRLQEINEKRSTIKRQPVILPAVPCINGDHLFHRLFPYYGAPFHVWISSEGKILAMTKDYNATPEHIAAAIAGKKIRLSNLKTPVDFDSIKIGGLLKPRYARLPGSSYSGFLPYSEDLDIRNTPVYRDSIVKTLEIYCTNFSALEFYKRVFHIDDKHLRVLLEMKNKENYLLPADDNQKDEWQEKNLFSYELCIPLRDEGNADEYMQQDANRFYGSLYGINARMEKRKYQSFVLTKIKDGLLYSSGTPYEMKYEQDSLMYVNDGAFSEIVDLLRYSNENMQAGRPFIDETAIDPNLKMDMRLTGDLKNMQNVRKQLRQYGLDIIEGERDIEVLVIGDKK